MRRVTGAAFRASKGRDGRGSSVRIAVVIRRFFPDFLIGISNFFISGSLDFFNILFFRPQKITSNLWPRATLRGPCSRNVRASGKWAARPFSKGEDANEVVRYSTRNEHPQPAMKLT